VQKKTLAAGTGESEQLARMKQALAAFQSAPEERQISAMQVVVHYVASIERVEQYKRGEEYVYSFTRKVESGGTEERWEMLPRNAFAIRDEFQKVKTPTDALDFLSNTGVFSPLDFTITWSEFRRWQRFAYLVQEHSQLASAMKQSHSDQSEERLGVSGELQEALKALSGGYPSAFFDGTEIPQTPSMEDFNARAMQNPEVASAIREGERVMKRQQRELESWFRQPPGNAWSIQWVPKSEQDEEAIIRKLQAGGAMIEFLLPRAALRPLLLIRPRFTLEAIAAAIFADNSNGVEYRACNACSALFKIGAHKDKKYCDEKRCKNTAHQRRMRANRAKAQKKIANQTKGRRSNGSV
jgi:hypothetical protein